MGFSQNFGWGMVTETPLLDHAYSITRKKLDSGLMTKIKERSDWLFSKTASPVVGR